MPDDSNMKLYETPEGVAVRLPECTIYTNVSISQRHPSLVCFRVNKVLPDGRKYLTTFDLDAEMAEILAGRIIDVAAQAEGNEK